MDCSVDLRKFKRNGRNGELESFGEFALSLVSKIELPDYCSIYSEQRKMYIPSYEKISVRFSFNLPFFGKAIEFFSHFSSIGT